MARAYSWWVAKGCCSLAIFKVSALFARHAVHMLMIRLAACQLYCPQGPDKGLPPGVLIAALY